MMKTHSFVDVHGAVVTIAPDGVDLYLGVKSEQLSALTQLMTNVEVGAIELNERDREIFHLMVNEYAKSVESLIEVVISRKKGGAA